MREIRIPSKEVVKEEIIRIIRDEFSIDELNKLAGESLIFWSKNEEGTELESIYWDEN